jgi:hypothetical protein
LRDKVCNIHSAVWISSAGIWSVPGDLYLLSYRVAISSPKELVSGAIGSCLHFCLLNIINAMYIQ